MDRLVSFQNGFFQAVEWLMDTRGLFYKLVLVCLTGTTVFWLSVFLYGTFYYFYIPPVAHLRPVHLQFDSLCDKDICKFPSANVSLLYRGQPQLLTRGQQYKIYLDLEMPESPVNRMAAGMFMVKLDMYTRYGVVIQSSYRSAVLHYKSLLVRVFQSVTFAPMFLFGSKEEKQKIEVLLFDTYTEDYVDRTAGASIEIHSHSIEIYNALLRIEAHLSGLRYIMYQWPITSAVFGIATNFFFLSFIMLCSWFHVILSKNKAKDDSRDSHDTQAVMPIIHPKTLAPDRPTSVHPGSNYPSLGMSRSSTAAQRSYLQQVLENGTIGRIRQQFQMPVSKIASSSSTSADAIVAGVENLYSSSIGQSLSQRPAGQDQNIRDNQSESETTEEPINEEDEQSQGENDSRQNNVENEQFQNAFKTPSSSPSVFRRHNAKHGSLTSSSH